MPYERNGKKMATKEKNIWVLILFLLAGLVVGGLIGKLASGVPGLWWLSFGESFGLTTPIELDLSIFKITFGLIININLASIIGMLLALLIYRKV